MPRIRFNQDTTFEDRTYRMGQEYDLSEEKVRALGTGVTRMSAAKPATEKDATEMPVTNKMVKGAPRKK